MQWYIYFGQKEQNNKRKIIWKTKPCLNSIQLFCHHLGIEICFGVSISFILHFQWLFITTLHRHTKWIPLKEKIKALVRALSHYSLMLLHRVRLRNALIKGKKNQRAFTQNVARLFHRMPHSNHPFALSLWKQNNSENKGSAFFANFLSLVSTRFTLAISVALKHICKLHMIRYK